MFLGLMSGTSLDGLDIVLATPPKTIHQQSFVPYPDDMVDELEPLKKPNALSADVQTMDVRLGQFYAQEINRFLATHQIDKSRIEAIGLHGQTINHRPNDRYPYSLQLGNANHVAWQTGIKTIADFRNKDLAAGGQGAPLTAAFNLAFFGRANQIVLNIGGIANISHLSETVIGFDTGPGNGLLDEWFCAKHPKSATRFDVDGAWARSGTVDEALVEALLADDYFEQSLPKSTGREYFNLSWFELILTNFPDIPPADAQASLVELTARSVAASCLPLKPSAILLCGGGRKNSYLIERIRYHCGRLSVSDDIGVDPDMLEALAFAWLAEQTLQGRSANLPSVTGASKPTILGAIYWP